VKLCDVFTAAKRGLNLKNKRQKT